MKFATSLLAATVAFAALSAASQAEAAIVINVRQVGTTVEFDASGTFDRSLGSPVVVNTRMTKVAVPDLAFIGFGANPNIDQYATVGAPFRFGSESTFTFIQANAGSAIGMNGGAGAFFIDTGYVSNRAFNAFAFIENRTLASIGLNEASYSFLAGGNRVTVNIGSPVAAVPEAATWGMMIAGFGMMGAALRTRRRTVAFA
jgi:hypothetical protein